MTYAWLDCGDGRSVYRKIVKAEPKRSDIPAPMIIGDHIEPVQSMASGKMYDSKSALRSEYKAMGFVEVGNDAARLQPKPKEKPDRTSIRDSVKKAAAQWSSGVRPA